MSKYIDADKLDKKFNEILDNPKEYDKPIHDMLRAFYFASAEDVEPVRHGHWILCQPKSLHLDRRDSLFECSVCRMNRIRRTGEVLNYCPHCGTKMDEKEKEHE